MRDPESRADRAPSRCRELTVQIGTCFQPRGSSDGLRPSYTLVLAGDVAAGNLHPWVPFVPDSCSVRNASVKPDAARPPKSLSPRSCSDLSTRGDLAPSRCREPMVQTGAGFQPRGSSDARQPYFKGTFAAPANKTSAATTSVAIATDNVVACAMLPMIGGPIMKPM